MAGKGKYPNTDDEQVFYFIVLGLDSHLDLMEFKAQLIAESPRTFYQAHAILVQL